MNPRQATAPILPDGWSDLDITAIDTVRLLAADAVQKVGNGHPGTAMSLAPAAYLLYQKVMRHDPTDPEWTGRDRFVLSCGHSSLTQYIQLYLGGFGLELDDLKSLRTWGSKTPGHPEYGHTAAVEITTGPLGQGVANAVGMAMASRRERGLLDPDAAPGESPFDHHVYALCSDGDLEEGVSGEASSLAGTQRLGNLTVIYDSNQISIEDDTNIAFTEDVGARYAAYGWHVQTVDWTSDDTSYVEDIAALDAAVAAAGAVTDQPSFIVLKTVIAWPAPTKQGTGGSHGSALGNDEIAATKELLGFDPEQVFEVPDEVLAHTRGLIDRGQAAHAEWQKSYDAWAAANPAGKALHDRLVARALPEGWRDALPTFPADAKGVATRAASGKVLSALADTLPELWGGSADLAGSNNTTMDGEPSFLPLDRQSKKFPGNPYGRTLHFGIREHAMGSIMNGIAVHGGTRPYGGTFLVFSDYMRGAVRLSALMKLPVTYVWTHDSIGVGEDGPTHQPIEHVAALRAIPGLDVVRPGDGNETAAAWAAILEHNDRPAGLILTRQNLPTFPRGTDGFADTSGVAKGAYVLKDSEGTPDVILIGTGSEVQLAVAAAEQLAEQGIAARVVSMPCREWFDEQDQEYKDSVIPPEVTARVSVEAGISQGWRDVVGDAGRIVSINHYGASAAGGLLFTEFGFTPEAVVTAAQESLAAATETTAATAAAVNEAASGPVGTADTE
ncbi:transketolase [Microlunatus phosphovorus NM-1]|uniref:Transketolase n=1 Tax=Microlunatus phosphovorus (strain ATCC 700054 / DSM 10555 / JCM 9379 / NBRC 101784 / NCIMB 13414 / VKM Ac-1990 / NM-1) TaxID=1032480 RepID=F5XQE1_MICPN|nr:transketolase [Microlunatus phosphovorus]BAK34441.1 transketolase [Microlunatus phosphovorus NM-1]